MQTKNTFRLCSILAALALASVSAQASYGNLAQPPGVYFGSGNVNGNWTINANTSNGIELGLRVKNRQTGALLDGSTGTYFADPGTYAGGGIKARWNYEFSVNIGPHSFSDGLTFRLGVDHDPSAGQTFSWVDPQTYWSGDNATVANGFQNSQNVGFGDTPGGAFDVNQNGLYTFVLEGSDTNGRTFSTSMNVQVGAVPEPGTYALMLAGLGLLGFVARRRTRK